MYITPDRKLEYVSCLQFFGLFALSMAYKLHPVITPDIPANTNLTTAPLVRIAYGYYYFVVEKLKNWFEAYETCRTLDAKLITIDSIEELNDINRHMSGQLSICTGHPARMYNV